MKKHAASAVCLFGALCASTLLAASKVTEGTLALPTYPFSDPDPVPCVAERRYPYFRYDGSSATSATQSWTCVTLENDRVVVTMLPQIGGKVWGALDKATGREFIYFNHAVKFRDIAMRDIAMRGPWCSGGIEFNFGVIGHSPNTATPVDWAVRQNQDGSASYFASATEYVNGTTWQVEVNLPPDADYFLTRTTWFNGANLPGPYYHWMTAAYSARGNPSLAFPGSAYIGHGGDAHSWHVDWKGRDLSVYANNAFGPSKSYHVLNGDNRIFALWWPEAAFGSYHYAAEKYGRKIWLWALSREGGIWEDLLTDVDGQYVELQSGRAFNQPNGESWRTPFKHLTFAPGATDMFEERWGVVRDAAQLVSLTSGCACVERPLQMPDEFDWTTAYGLYLRGQQALRTRDDKTGEESLRECLAKEPAFVPALNTLAGLAARRGGYAEVRELCARALAVDTYDAEANYLDGFAAHAQGSDEEARERLLLAAYSPLYRASAYVLLAKGSLRKGDWAAASDYAMKATQAGSFNFDAWLVRVIAARRRGDVKAARSILRLARQVVPLFHGARFEEKLIGMRTQAFSTRRVSYTALRRRALSRACALPTSSATQVNTRPPRARWRRRPSYPCVSRFRSGVPHAPRLRGRRSPEHPGNSATCSPCSAPRREVRRRRWTLSSPAAMTRTTPSCSISAPCGARERNAALTFGARRSLRTDGASVATSRGRMSTRKTGKRLRARRSPTFRAIRATAPSACST